MRRMLCPPVAAGGSFGKQGSSVGVLMIGLRFLLGARVPVACVGSIARRTQFIFSCVRAL